MNFKIPDWLRWVLILPVCVAVCCLGSFLARTLILDALAWPDGMDAPQFLKELGYSAMLPLLVVAAGTSMAPTRRFLVALVLSGLYVIWLSAFTTVAVLKNSTQAPIWWLVTCGLVSVVSTLAFCFKLKKDDDLFTEHPAAIPIGLFLLCACFFGLALFGSLFRAHTFVFAFAWLTIPAFAYALSHPTVMTWFTLTGLRGIQTILMTLAVLLSFCMFCNYDHLRNPIGKRFVEGYTFWRAEPETDDNGAQYYPGDEWTADNWTGRWGLHLFVWTTFALMFAVPALTLKASRKAIQKKETECESISNAIEPTGITNDSGQTVEQDAPEMMYLDFKLPSGLQISKRTELDDVQKLAANAIVSGFRRLAAHNGCAPTAQTSDEKIIEIYAKVTSAFNDVAKKRGERIPAMCLNGIVMKFLQIYEWRFEKDEKSKLHGTTAEKFFTDHLQYELDKYLAEGLRPDYRREVPLF